MKFREDAEPQASGDLWYDLTDGGYIDPYDFLEEEDAKKVCEAAELVKVFFDEAEARGLLEDM